jgi:chemotaxis protein MotB
MKPVLLLLSVLTLYGCVSNKKYKEAGQRIASLEATVGERDRSINTLRLDLAECKGGNAALFATQDKLQDRLDELQHEIDRLRQTAASTRENLNTRIQEQEAIVMARQAKIDAVREYFIAREAEMQAIAQAIREKLHALPGNLTALEVRNGQAVIALNERLMFKGNSTTQLETGGKTALDAINDIVQQHPLVVLEVTGHTDNQPVPRQSLDNWQYSALRAVSVVKYLTQERLLGPNRVTAASRGEYAPRASNETAEGKTENRRIEIVIQFRDSDLMREINKIISG